MTKEVKTCAATPLCPWCTERPATLNESGPTCEECASKADRSAICFECKKPVTPDQQLGFGRVTQYIPPRPESWYAYHKACSPVPLCPWCHKYPVSPIPHRMGYGPMCEGCREDSWNRDSHGAKCYDCGGQLKDTQRLVFEIPQYLGGELNNNPPHMVGYHVSCLEEGSPCHPYCHGCYACIPYGEEHPEEF